MAAHWLSDLELEEPTFFHHSEADCLTQFTEQQIAVAFNQNQNHGLRQYSISSGDNTDTTLFNCTPMNIPLKSETTAQATCWGSGIIAQISSSPMILSFGAQDAAMEEHAVFYGGLTSDINQCKREVEIALSGIVGEVGGNYKRGDVIRKGGNDNIRIYSQSQREREEHILAERKRREKLSQRFIALTKIVPGLKKTDKASVLEDAIKYLKQLQDKVQDLETQATQHTIESAVIVKRSHVPADKYDVDTDKNCPCDENLINKVSTLKSLPEIEAKMSERTVIIKIHCQNHKGALVKVLAEIEALGLSITSTNVMPFAGSSLDITAVAQIEEDSMSMKDVVKKLNQSFKQPT